MKISGFLLSIVCIQWPKICSTIPVSGDDHTLSWINTTHNVVHVTDDGYFRQLYDCIQEVWGLLKSLENKHMTTNESKYLR